MLWESNRGFSALISNLKFKISKQFLMFKFLIFEINPKHQILKILSFQAATWNPELVSNSTLIAIKN